VTALEEGDEFNIKSLIKTNPVAAPSKASVCGPSLAGIAGLNLPSVMDISLLRLWYVVS
jgi:hypothetical protein